MKINLVLIEKNESRSIERCLRAAAPFVDQFIVTDTGSSDGTEEIIRRTAEELEIPCEIHHFAWINDFSAARNFAMERSEAAHADYHLMIDSDEYLISDAVPELLKKPGSCRGSRSALEEAIRRAERHYGRGGFLGAVGIYHFFLENHGVISKETKATKNLWNEISELPNLEQELTLEPHLFPDGTRYEGLIHEQPKGSCPIVALPLSAEHDGYLFENKAGRNLPYLEKEIQLHPQDPYYQYQMAETLRVDGKIRESYQYFENFLSMMKFGGAVNGEKPALPDYCGDAVVSYLYALMNGAPEDLGRGEKLIRWVEEKGFLQNNPDYYFCRGQFFTRFVLADLRSRAGLLPEIERSYARALEIGEMNRTSGTVGTGSFKAAYNLGLWYELNGQMKAAAVYYQKSSADGFKLAEERLRNLNRRR